MSLFTDKVSPQKENLILFDLIKHLFLYHLRTLAHDPTFCLQLKGRKGERE